MKKIWIFLFLGIIIRIFLAATTFHPDIQAFNLSGKIISSGNFLNLYDYLVNLSNSNPLKSLAVFNYPPAVYWFHGIFNFIFSDILKFSFLNQFLSDDPSNYGKIFFNLHLLFLKIPYIIFDLSTAFVLYKIFKSQKEAIFAFAIWMFNPINLYSTYMIGQFDIIPTFFTILSLYLVFKKKLLLAALALGGGIAFKLYPIFLLIPLAVVGKNYLEKIKLVILVLLPYSLSIIPYLSSHNFRTTALFASQSSKSLYADIPVSGGESIILFPTFLLFFYLMVLGGKFKIAVWKIYSIPLILFFIFTHFHPQWLVWLTPFLIIDLTYDTKRNILPISLIYLSFLGSLFFFDPSLTVNIFAPLFPFLHNQPSIWSILHLIVDYNLGRSFLQTVFVASSFYLIYDYVIKKNS